MLTIHTALWTKIIVPISVVTESPENMFKFTHIGQLLTTCTTTKRFNYFSARF